MNASAHRTLQALLSVSICSPSARALGPFCFGCCGRCQPPQTPATRGLACSACSGAGASGVKGRDEMDAVRPGLGWGLFPAPPSEILLKSPPLPLGSQLSSGGVHLGVPVGSQHLKPLATGSLGGAALGWSCRPSTELSSCQSRYFLGKPSMAAVGTEVCSGSLYRQQQLGRLGVAGGLCACEPSLLCRLRPSWRRWPWPRVVTVCPWLCVGLSSGHQALPSSRNGNRTQSQAWEEAAHLRTPLTIPRSRGPARPGHLVGAELGEEEPPSAPEAGWAESARPGFLTGPCCGVGMAMPFPGGVWERGPPPPPHTSWEQPCGHRLFVQSPSVVTLP